MRAFSAATNSSFVTPRCRATRAACASRAWCSGTHGKISSITSSLPRPSLPSAGPRPREGGHAARAVPPRAERRVHARHQHVREMAAPDEVGSHLDGVGALAAVVKLGGKLLLDLVEGGRGLRRKGVHDGLERKDVAAEGLLGLWVLDLDDDTLAARAQHRAVRLADGGAAERRLLELREDLAQRHAQLLLDDGSDLGKRARRDPVEERLKHVDVQLGHHA
mmetsp:Transcript_29977/g.100211  ORF Transcript_29977/g.100211 Transcript_29977/m.100211 type:complete len:221 (-) Transcript_29977:365-1027(-)